MKSAISLTVERGKAAELFRRFALVHVAGDLDAVAPAFFGEDVGDVHLNGSTADAKLVRDLFVAQPARGERSLSRRQSLPFCFVIGQLLGGTNNKEGALDIPTQ